MVFQVNFPAVTPSVEKEANTTAIFRLCMANIPSFLLLFTYSLIINPTFDGFSSAKGGGGANAVEHSPTEAAKLYHATRKIGTTTQHSAKGFWHGAKQPVKTAANDYRNKAAERVESKDRKTIKTRSRANSIKRKDKMKMDHDVEIDSEEMREDLETLESDEVEDEEDEDDDNEEAVRANLLDRTGEPKCGVRRLEKSPGRQSTQNRIVNGRKARVR